MYICTDIPQIFYVTFLRQYDLFSVKSCLKETCKIIFLKVSENQENANEIFKCSHYGHIGF